MFDKKKFMATLVLKDMTIKQLADEIGISYSTLHKKINNKSHFYCFEIKKISKLLGVENPLSYFFID